MMLRWRNVNSCAVSLIVLMALTCAFAPKAAAQTGTITGTVLDINAKPWADVGEQAVSDQGVKQDAKTDNDGKYSIGGLRPGGYRGDRATFPHPHDKEPPGPQGEEGGGGGAHSKADSELKAQPWKPWGAP